MSDTRETYGIRMARASNEELDALEAFFETLEQMNNQLIDEGGFGEMSDKITEFAIREGVENRQFSLQRILWGYRTLVHNACDQTKDYLAWKPEIEQALKGNLTCD